jgi:uncharacterized protein YhaN
MKIKQLIFSAFGPFTEKHLIFDQHEKGLQIIYGPNEAGKSSALRGLKALLYGIQERTLDNFLHAAKELRINGCLQNGDGKELVISRRKGRKNTLLDGDGNALDEQVLNPFLNGIKLPLFEALFGIDHQALQQGGQEILQQKGEVGQTLFSASLGSHSLHTVLEQLDVEAEELFKPRGSNQKINASLKLFSDLKKEIKDISLPSKNWDDQRRALDLVTSELTKTQSELKDNRSEVTRLTRIKNALPRLARLTELLREQETLGDVVILPDDFVTRHLQAVKAIDSAQLLLEKTTPRLNGLKNIVEKLSVNQDLLDQTETIEDLHARLGGHRKALQDKPHLKSQREQLLKEAEYLLKDIRPDLDLTEVEVLRPVLSRQKAITELGNQKTLLLSKVDQVAKNQLETQTQLKAARKEKNNLPDLASSEALRLAIKTARKLGDLDGLINLTQSDIRNLQSQCGADLSRLSLRDGVLEDLPGLRVPNRESVNHFEKSYDDLDKRTQKLKDKQGEVDDAIKTAQHSLDEMHRAGDVPTEEDLVELRAVRDQIWKLLRRQWIDKEDISLESSHLLIEDSLPDTFERRLLDTDELSDRLRREAERVHAMASLKASEKALISQLSEINHGLDTCTLEKTKLDSEWNSLWANSRILPRTPREMRLWLEDQEKLRNKVEELNEYKQKNEGQVQSRSTHIQLLNEQLVEAGNKPSKSENLEPVLMACEELSKQIDQAKTQRDALNQTIDRLEADLESLSGEHRMASDKLKSWLEKWRVLIEGFGLASNSTPSEVSDIIEKLRKLFDTQKDVGKLQIRIDAIDEDADAFQKQVISMMDNMLPEENKLSVEDAVIRLNSLLAENQSNKKQLKHINTQIEDAKNEIQESNNTIKIMSERLDSLVVEAKCGEHTQLEVAERNSDEYRRIKREIKAIELELIQLGEGVSIANLRLEAEGIDPDELPARIEALNNRIEDELDPQRNELTETKGRKQKELELMDGSDHAALLADQAQTKLASIRSDTERYVRLKLSSKVLRDEIERYRKENQGPLVKSASESFAVLTGGSFESLRADFNEKDEPVLVGIRPNGDQVHVEGMSSGTRDQLYLALRLASLEKFMEGSEPMPFIVDDILVDFDDERSESALIALSQLAKKTQVIMFTHHSRVVEQARKIGGPVNIQELI